MKTSALFKQVITEAGGDDTKGKDTKSFVQKVRESEQEESNPESESDEPTSMAEAFRRFADSGRKASAEGRVKTKKKKPKPEKPEEVDPEIKISVPKKSEKPKKAPESKEKEDESGDESEEEGEEAPPPKKATKTKPDDDPDGDDSEFSEKKAELEEDEATLKRLLAIDPDTLVSNTGQPISKKAADNIRKLKEHLDYFAKKAKKLQESVPEYDPRLKINYEQIKAAHDELKKKYADRYFEETPEWEENFIKPLKTASSEMAKWLKSHDHAEDQDSLDQMQIHRQKLEEALSKGDDVMYYEHVDALAEFLKKGASARFQAAAPSLWEAFQKKEEAYKNKDEARKQIREKSFSQAEDEAKKAAASIDSAIQIFEKKNATIIDAYKNNPAYREFIDYDNTVLSPINDAKTHLELAVKRRTITPGLTDLVVKGALFELKMKEQEGFLERIKVLEEEKERLEKRLADSDRTISKVRPSKAVTEFDGDDEEDDSDEPQSFAEHFKRKRKLGLV